MDNFWCFIYAGAFFIIFGLWYLVQSCRRCGMTRQRGIQFSSTHSYTCDFLCGNFRDHPLESMLKIAMAVTGLVLEFITGADEDWSPLGMMHGKFATFYFFFAMSAAIDLAMHYGAPFPADLDYLLSASAFFIEWILFRFPKQGRSDLEQVLYTLLEYVIFICFVAVVMEMRNRKQIIFVLARSYFMLLQGTWLCQMAFVLYKPAFGITWSDHKVRDLTLTVLFFAWHCGVTLLLVLAVGGVIGLVYRRKGLVLQQHEDEEIQMQSLLKPSRNGKMIISLGSFTNEEEEDESEIEYQQRPRRP